MKKYTINVHYDACYTAEVIAPNEEKAFLLARNSADNADSNSFDFDYQESCITDVEEFDVKETLPELKESMRNIDKRIAVMKGRLLTFLDNALTDKFEIDLTDSDDTLFLLYDGDGNIDNSCMLRVMSLIYSEGEPTVVFENGEKQPVNYFDYNNLSALVSFVDGVISDGSL